MLAGTYSTSAAIVSAAVVCTPLKGRDMIGEPQRMHSAVVPGSSACTRWASPQVSQARTDSWLAMGFSTVSRRRRFLLYISRSFKGVPMRRALVVVAALLLGG